MTRSLEGGQYEGRGPSPGSLGHVLESFGGLGVESQVVRRLMGCFGLKTVVGRKVQCRR